MNFPIGGSNQGTGEPAGAKPQQRRHGRLHCQDVTSILGDILDLSASGMRVLCAVKPPPVGQPVQAIIKSCEGDLSMPCSVVWVRRKGFFRHEMGVQFGEIDATIRASLTRLARSVSQNETILPSLRASRKAG
jgi:hypothetical protein